MMLHVSIMLTGGRERDMMKSTGPAKPDTETVHSAFIAFPQGTLGKPPSYELRNDYRLHVFNPVLKSRFSKTIYSLLIKCFKNSNASELSFDSGER